MTTPVEPPSIPPEISIQQQAQSAEVMQTDELRAFIAELVKQTSLGFDPGTVVKGTVTAISAGTTPPTLTINISGDTTVPVAGVRYIDSYSPAVSDTILLLKQGPVLFAIGRIAAAGTLGQGGGSGGWTVASLASGFTHNGDSQGNVEYRKVWDNGSWKMQWRGAAARSANTTVISALATDFRPGLRRTVITAGSGPVLIDFNVDGSVVLDGTVISNQQNIGATNLQNTGATGGASAGTAHTHGHDHTHQLNHTHEVQFISPTYVSFNGVEYFL